VKTPRGATSFQPSTVPLSCDTFLGSTIRHTFRANGTGDWLLIYTLGGSGLYKFNGGEYRSRPHDVTLFRPGAFQDYQIAPGAKKWDLHYAHFVPRAEWLPWLAWPQKAEGFCVLSVEEPGVSRQVVQRLRDMIRHYHTPQPRRTAFAQNALEEAILWLDAINPAQAFAQIDPRVRKAMNFLTQHATEPFSEEQLARAAGISPSRLRHLFRKQAGDSPRKYQEAQRLRRARDLLAMSRQTIGEIANELGFENPFYFTLRFKKETGESPRAYRQRIIGR
jgi:AraC family transcriptional regulator of arabinose operon